MEYQSLKRKELQALCKKHCVPANLTNLEMANRLTQIIKVKENTTSRDGSKKNSEEDAMKKKLKLKKVRFSPEIETREYDLSVCEKPVRRITRRASMILKESEEKNVSRMKRGKGNEQMKSDSRVTRSLKAVVEKEETNYVIKKGIEAVSGQRGSRGKKIDTGIIDEEEEAAKGVGRSRRNVAISKDYVVVKFEGVRRITRSSASAVVGEDGLLELNESLKGALGKKASTRQSTMQINGDDETGSHGKKGLKAAMKRSKSVSLEAETEHKGCLGTGEGDKDSVVMKFEGVRRITRSSSSAVVGEDKLVELNEPLKGNLGRKVFTRQSVMQIHGDGEVGSNGKEGLKAARKRSRNVGLEAETEHKESLETEKGNKDSVVMKFEGIRRITRSSASTVVGEDGLIELNESLKGASSQKASIWQSVVQINGDGEVGSDGKVGLKAARKRSRNASLEVETVHKDSLETGEDDGKASVPDACPRRSRRKTIVLNSTIVSSKESASGLPVGNGKQSNEADSGKHAYVGEIAECVEETGRPQRFGGQTILSNSTSASDESIIGEAIGKGKQSNKIVLGKGAHVIDEPRRSTRNRSRLHLAAASNETNAIAMSTSVGQESEKSETVQEIEIVVAADEVLVGKTSKSTRNASKKRKEDSNQMNETPESIIEVGSQRKKCETVQDKETVLAAEGVGMVGRPQKSRRKTTVLSTTSTSDESGTGETTGKRKQLIGIVLEKGAHVTDEPRRSKRTSPRLQLALVSDEAKIAESVSLVVQGSRRSETVQEIKTAVVADEILVGKTPRRSVRLTFQTDMVGTSAPYESVEKKQKSTSGVTMMKETTPTKISGKDANVTDETRRSARYASRKGMEAVYGDMTEDLKNVVEARSRREKHKTVKKKETVVVADDSLVVETPRRSTRFVLRSELPGSSVSHNFVVKQEKSVSRTIPKNISGKVVYVADETLMPTKSYSGQRLAATSDEMNEIAGSAGEVEPEREKCDTVQETETTAATGEFLVVKTPRRSTRHVLKNKVAGASVAYESVEKKEPSISSMSVMVEETTTTNISGKIARVTNEPLRYTRSSSSLAAISCQGMVGQQDEKSKEVQEAENDTAVDELLVGNTPRRSTRLGSRSDLVGLSNSSKSAKKKQRSMSRASVIRKETALSNISGKSSYVIDEPRRTTRSASGQRSAATSNATNAIAERVGKVRIGTEKCQLLQGTETDAIANEISVGKTPRPSTRRALRTDLIGSSASVGKKQQSISRVSIMRKETLPRNISLPIENNGLTTSEVAGERNLGSNSNYATDSSEKRGVSKTKSRRKEGTASVDVSAMNPDIGAVIHNAANSKEILEAAPLKLASVSLEEEASKAVREPVGASALHYNAGLEMNSVRNLKEFTESATRKLVTASTTEETPKVAQESVVVIENICLMDEIGNKVGGSIKIDVNDQACQSLEIYADLDNHDSTDIKAKTCDVFSHSDAFSSVKRSILEGESSDISGMEKVMAREQMMSGEDAFSESDDISNDLAEFDRIPIEKGGDCGLEKAERDNAMKEIEDWLEPDNVGSVPAFSAEIVTKSSTKDVCQETDGVNDFFSEFERISVPKDEIIGLERTEKDDTKDRNHRGVMLCDRQASPALGIKTVVGEIEVMHNECKDLDERHDYSVAAVVPISPHSACNFTRVIDEHQHASNSKLFFYASSLSLENRKQRKEGTTVATNSNDEEKRDFLEGMPSEELGDEKQGNPAITKSSNDEILCQEDIEDWMVGERGSSFGSSGDETFSFGVSSEQMNLDLSSERFHAHKEMVVDNCSIDVVMEVPITEYCKPLENVVNQSMDEKRSVEQLEIEDLSYSLIAELGDKAGSEKVAAEVNSINDSSFSLRICEEHSDSHIAMKKIISGKDETAERSKVMKFSDHGSCVEVAMSLIQSSQQSEFSNEKNVESLSKSEKIRSIETEEKETKFEASDSKVGTSGKCIGNHLDAEKASDVRQGVCDGILENDNAADRTRLMDINSQWVRYEGSLEPNSSVKPDNGSSKNVDPVVLSLSEAVSTDFGGLNNTSDEVKISEIHLEVETVDLNSEKLKLLPEVATSDFEDVKIGDAKEKVGEMEGSLAGKDTNRDADKEVDYSLFSPYENTCLKSWIEKDAVISEEEPLEDNLMGKDSGQVTPTEQDQIVKLAEALEYNLTSEQVKDLAIDREVGQVVELQFCKVVPSVADELINDDVHVIPQEFNHLPNYQDKEMENTFLSVKGALAEAASFGSKEQDVPVKFAPGNLKEAENISYPCGQGINEDVVGAKDNDASIIPTRKIDIHKEADGGAAVLIPSDETSPGMSRTEIEENISTSQWEGDMQAVILPSADAYCGKPETDLCSPSPRQSDRTSNEGCEGEIIASDEVTIRETGEAQKAGQHLNNPADGSSLEKDTRDHQDIIKEQFDLRQNPVSKEVFTDDNDCLALNKLSCKVMSEIPLTATGEPDLLHELDVVNSEKAAELEK